MLLKILFPFYTTILANFAIPGHLSVASFAIGPFRIVPLGFPFSSFNTTAALSSNFILVPSGLRYSFFCLTIIASTTCFLILGIPLTTEAFIISPIPAACILPFTVLLPQLKQNFSFLTMAYTPLTLHYHL